MGLSSASSATRRYECQVHGIHKSCYEISVVYFVCSTYPPLHRIDQGVAANEHQGSIKCQENRDRRKCQPNQGICYRDITLINLVNCKRIKKGTYIIDCIQLNTWRLNSVNESNIIKELINEPRATANTRYIYK